jgi:hypothetical protein
MRIHGPKGSFRLCINVAEGLLFSEDGFRSDWEDQETEHASDYSFLFLAKLPIYWNYQKNNYFCYQVFVSKDSHRIYIWTSSKEKK